MGLEGSRRFARHGFAPATKHRSTPTLPPTPTKGPVNDDMLWNTYRHVRPITLNRWARVRVCGEIDKIPLFATEVP